MEAVVPPSPQTPHEAAPGPRDEPSDDDLLEAIHRAHHASLTTLSGVLRAANLSPSAFGVLWTLEASTDDHLEPHALATRLRLSRPSVTGLLDTLERRALVERQPHPDDGRRVLVVLTPAGAQVVDDFRPIRAAALQTLFTDLDDPERERLATLLGRVGEEDAREEALAESSARR